jgi:hypothetical protein
MRRLRLFPLVAFASCAHALPLEPAEMQFRDGTQTVLRIRADGTIESYLDLNPIGAVGPHTTRSEWVKAGTVDRAGHITGGFVAGGPRFEESADVQSDGSIVDHWPTASRGAYRLTDEELIVGASSGCKPLRVWLAANGRLRSKPEVYSWATGTGVTILGATSAARRRTALAVLALGHMWRTGLNACESPDPDR